MNRTLPFSPARASIVWLALVLVVTATGFNPLPAADVVITHNESLGRFEVSNLDAKALADFAASRPSFADWNKLFFVAVVGAADPPVPMLGEHSVEGGRLYFKPRFPLRAGEFVARLDPIRLAGGVSAVIEKRLRIAAKPVGPPATVTEIYPTSDTLPENVLKFYLHFTAPMRRGESYEHIKLLDGQGRVIEGPFLELGEELWDASGQRFTLLIHPGRIKQGLKPREDLGPVMEANKSYTLVIGAGWKDAEGRPLGSERKKSFRTTAALELPVALSDWKMVPPPAATREPLTVTFPRPLDHALLLRVVHVLNAAGGEVDGEIAISERETRWQFIPRRAWAAGSYNLEVEQILEDLAGNSVGRTFEVDVERPIPVLQNRTRLPFTVIAK